MGVCEKAEKVVGRREAGGERRAKHTSSYRIIIIMSILITVAIRMSCGNQFE